MAQVYDVLCVENISLGTPLVIWSRTVQRAIWRRSSGYSSRDTDRRSAGEAMSDERRGAAPAQSKCKHASCVSRQLSHWQVGQTRRAARVEFAALSGTALWQ